MQRVRKQRLQVAESAVVGYAPRAIARANRQEAHYSRGVTLNAPEDIVGLPLVQDIREKRQEHFVCITVDAGNKVINARVVTIGLLDSSQVHPREVFADAITDRAAAVVLVHNHPSGTLVASSSDQMITGRLIDAGNILGIRVLDHIIVTREGFLPHAGY